MGLLFVQLFSYSKREDDDRVTDRTDSSQAYNSLIWNVWRREHIDLSTLAPREWPSLSFFSEEEQQKLLDLHFSASTLKAFSDFDVKLVHRLLYYTPADLWLSDEDKDWHYPVLATLQEKNKIIGEAGQSRNWKRGGKRGSARREEANPEQTHQ